MKKEVKSKLPTKFEERKVKLSHKFVTVLAIISILGFIGIISETLFQYNIEFYVEALLMLIIGIGLIIEAKMKQIRSVARGFNSNNFTHLTTAIIGFIAVIAGIFSLPPIRITTPAFLSIKGIVSIIAIAVIAIQTWIIE